MAINGGGWRQIGGMQSGGALAMAREELPSIRPAQVEACLGELSSAGSWGEL